MRNNLGLGLRGPDIRPGLENRHLIIGPRSQNVKKGYGRSFPNNRSTFQDYRFSLVPVPLLSTLDFGVETLDMDLNIRFWTIFMYGLSLGLSYFIQLTHLSVKGFDLR